MKLKKFFNNQAKILVENFLTYYLDKYGFDLKNNVTYIVREDEQHIYTIKDETEEKIVYSIYFNVYYNRFGSIKYLNTIETNMIHNLMEKFKEVLNKDDKLESNPFKCFNFNYFKKKVKKIKLKEEIIIDEEVFDNFIKHVKLEFNRLGYTTLTYENFNHYIVEEYLEQ